MQQTILHCLETRYPFNYFQLHRCKVKTFNKNDLNETMPILWVIFQFIFYFFRSFLRRNCCLGCLFAVSLDLTLILVFLFFFLKGNFT